MFTFGYTSRKASFIKALVVLAFGLAGLASRTTFGRILGIVLLVFAVRDLYHLITTRPGKEDRKPQRAKEDARQPAAREDGLKITDLSGAREVEYKKEEGNYTKE